MLQQCGRCSKLFAPFHFRVTLGGDLSPSISVLRTLIFPNLSFSLSKRSLTATKPPYSVYSDKPHDVSSTTPTPIRLWRPSPTKVLSLHRRALLSLSLYQQPLTRFRPPLSARIRNFIDESYNFLGLYVTTLFSVHLSLLPIALRSCLFPSLSAKPMPKSRRGVIDRLMML